MKALPISVLIPTMNRPDSLEKTLSSIFSCEAIPAQIIVIDQSISEESKLRNKEVIKKYMTITNAVYMYQDKPSLTVARNSAFKLAENDILICSDDGVDVESNTIENVYRIMMDGSVALLGGLNSSSKGRSSIIGYFTGTRSFIKRKQGHVTASVLSRYPDQVQGQVNTEWAYGYFFAIRKTYVEKWGLQWDEKLIGYAYAEDLDFSYQYFKKASAEKLRCILDENVVVNHRASLEYRIPSSKEIYMYVINRAYISYKLNLGLFSELAMHWTNLCQLLSGYIKHNNSYQFYYDAIKRKKRIKKSLKSGIIPPNAYDV